MRLNMKLQSTIDYMVSYGVALAIIAVAIYVMSSFGLFNPYLSPKVCTPASGFICNGYTISSNGIVSVLFSQVTGTTLNINGVACSTNVNLTNASLPAYGNVHVVKYSGMPSAYPNALASSMVMQSDTANTIEAYCYNNKGYAKSKLGNTFNGYVWINYTVSGLPNKNNIVRIISITSKYT